ncbi:molybdopterin-dependent oxidoreductase [Candidatus Fermentibacteria bacterium]|nr:molybdopterin-dependent oxidoreductase [Candidatus Fermentibacteria bacterium]
MNEYDTTVVGHSVRKLDAMGLASGRHTFTDDFALPGMLHARLLLSPHAHARITSVDASEALVLPGVVSVVSAANAPRVFHTTAGQGFPEPSPHDSVMFDWKVRHVGDRVAVIAAVSEEVAEAALGLIRVNYEVLEPVFDPLRALEPGAPVIHDEPEAHAAIPVVYRPKQNLAASAEFSTGPVDEVWDQATHRLDRTYQVHRASHCAIEPHEVIAYLDPDGRLILRSSTQVPFHARRIVANVLGLPVGRVRVIKPRIGGGFGGKQEVFLEQIAGLLCLRTELPVRLRLTRQEVFMTSRTRHPQHLRLRSAADGEGRVTLLDLDTVLDTGAYGSHALTVATNTGSKVLPLVNRTRAVRFRARSAYTTLPVSGAYRGYGATQGAFALNVQMDEMARDLGLDVLELWRRNHIRSGESSPVFQALGEGTEGVPMSIRSCGLEQCLEQGSKAIGWEEKRGRGGNGRLVRGIGMAALMQGSGIPRIDMASATLKLNDDGSVNLLVGATDLGTGSDTILAQIAAETLGIRADQVVVYSSDTDLTPFDTGAYASSTTYISGEAVRRAASDLAGKIIRVAARMMGTELHGLSLRGGLVIGGDRVVAVSDVALRSLYQEDQEQLMGMASAWGEVSPPPFSAHFAEIEVDTLTGRIRVVRYVAAVDCGVAINPALAQGQTEGAVMNGIGYALCEEYLMDDRGRMRNGSFVGYRIPSSRDVPDLVTILVPTYEPTGPYGAKSISEISINGPLPVISNAVYDAVGVRLRSSPFTPDRVWRLLKGE